MIIMLANRLGGEDYQAIPWGWSEDHQIFGIMVAYGYVLILILQILGLTFGDNFPIQVTIYHFLKVILP
jgi:hypothetical protein